MRAVYVTVAFFIIYIVLIADRPYRECPRVCPISKSDALVCVVDTIKGCARIYANECVYRKDQCERKENFTTVAWAVCEEAMLLELTCAPRATFVP